MKDFHQRWQTLAEQAGSLANEALPDIPFGFATRVIAGARETATESWDDLISALGLKAIVITAAMCLVSAGFAYTECYATGIEAPALEQTLTNELPWP